MSIEFEPDPELEWAVGGDDEMVEEVIFTPVPEDEATWLTATLFRVKRCVCRASARCAYCMGMVRDDS